MQQDIPSFLKYMKFGIELETLQSKFKHESDNAKTKIRLQYAQELNNFRDSLINDTNKDILCKSYYHFQASPMLKSRERMSNSAVYKCENTKEYGPCWTIDYDGSVLPDSSQAELFGNTEIISPPLRVWNEDINKNTDTTADIRTTDFGATVLNLIMKKILPVNGEIKYGSNNSTSTHVHLSCISPASDLNYFKNPYYLLAIAIYWQRYQGVFLNLVSESRRNNQFCKKNPKLNPGLFKAMISAVCMGNFSSNGGGMIIKQIADNIAMDDSFKVDRKYGFNLQNLTGTGIGTMEFRIHHGTMDPQEIFNWVLLLSLFINTIMNEVYAAMTIPNISKDDKIKFYESLYNSPDGTFDELFDKFIKSSTLKKYYMSKYECGSTSQDITDDPYIEPIVQKINDLLSTDPIIGGGNTNMVVNMISNGKIINGNKKSSKKCVKKK